jgi:hypothetical protein
MFNDAEYRAQEQQRFEERRRYYQSILPAEPPAPAPRPRTAPAPAAVTSPIEAAREEGAAAGRAQALDVINLCEEMHRPDLARDVIHMNVDEARRAIVMAGWDDAFGKVAAKYDPPPAPAAAGARVAVPAAHQAPASPSPAVGPPDAPAATTEPSAWDAALARVAR